MGLACILKSQCPSVFSVYRGLWRVGAGCGEGAGRDAWSPRIVMQSIMARTSEHVLRCRVAALGKDSQEQADDSCWLWGTRTVIILYHPSELSTFSCPTRRQTSARNTARLHSSLSLNISRVPLRVRGHTVRGDSRTPASLEMPDGSNLFSYVGCY